MIVHLPIVCWRCDGWLWCGLRRRIKLRKYVKKSTWGRNVWNGSHTQIVVYVSSCLGNTQKMELLRATAVITEHRFPITIHYYMRRTFLERIFTNWDSEIMTFNMSFSLLSFVSKQRNRRNKVFMFSVISWNRFLVIKWGRMKIFTNKFFDINVERTKVKRNSMTESRFPSLIMMDNNNVNVNQNSHRSLWQLKALTTKLLNPDSQRVKVHWLVIQIS